MDKRNELTVSDNVRTIPRGKNGLCSSREIVQTELIIHTQSRV